MLPHDHCIIVHAKDETICCNIMDNGEGGGKGGGEGEGQGCSNTPIETDLSFSSIDL